MAITAVKRTVSLPSELVRDLEQQAKTERKTFSGVVQEALWEARRQRLTVELRQIQDFWSRRARERGVLTARDLKRYLAS